jgi:hypothetical protein
MASLEGVLSLAGFALALLEEGRGDRVELALDGMLGA